jgi:hypothetical protein
MPAIFVEGIVITLCGIGLIVSAIQMVAMMFEDADGE